MFQKHKIEIGLATAVFTLFLLFCGGAAVAGGGLTVPWWTVDGGGGLSQGGNFAVSGTPGQPDAGSTSGGQYTIHGGFWDALDTVISPPNDLIFLPFIVH